ncbi:GNAT family N-acetyltransferase [Xylanimonas allomyrinae]|uniref:GNAT family N-acetyltransferase n=1 Tax=Xylanimonas allomyrinae TaxID=2509459 RepID=A0A4P6ELM2_9MICO|nr:GNAT family N-acetyltransferase [Xylanimonas allomyrinae]QAY63166.1 GNAT family N-acetyltransferase [Xylanimonas allomyrinae]
MTTPRTVVVRPARAEEAADVAWLAATTFPLACPPGTPVEEMARHVASRLTPGHFRTWAASPDHVLLVAARGDTLLGYALLVLAVPGGDEARVLRDAAASTGPVVELSKIYAHPEALGTGASSALMVGAVEAATRLAATHGLGTPPPLWLGTNAGNARAQAFYRKHGFVVVGTRTFDVGGKRHDDVVMLHRPAGAAQAT